MPNLTKTVFYYDDGSSIVEEVVAPEAPVAPSEPVDVPAVEVAPVEDTPVAPPPADAPVA